MDTIDKISHRLIDKKMSGNDLTKAIGIRSSGTWSQWKSGKTKPSAKNLESIAVVLECSVDDLLPDIGNEKPATYGDGLTEDERDIIRLFRMVSPETRAAMLHLLRSAEAVRSTPGDGVAK